MPLVDRCDAIARLIDDALFEFATGVTYSDDREVGDDGAIAVQRAADGRWWQRSRPAEPAGVHDAAA